MLLLRARLLFTIIITSTFVFAIIIIIIYYLYARYLKLHTRSKPRLKGIYCRRYSVVTIYGAFNPYRTNVENRVSS